MSTIGVVVDVDHAGGRVDALRYLVGVVRGRDARADVQELTYAGLGDQVVHGPAEERAVAADPGRHRRVGGHELLRQFPVRGEVVLPAQPVVVDPRDVRHVGIERNAGIQGLISV
jgi:hypothetical protein